MPSLVWRSSGAEALLFLSVMQPRVAPVSSSSRPRLLLIDGHSMAFRAFYALPVENFATTTGQPTNAVFGFTSMLINLLAGEEPTHVAVAFDAGRTTFRTEQHAEYKATSDQTPEPFRVEVDQIGRAHV